jgi:hypothetical protein
VTEEILNNGAFLDETRKRDLKLFEKQEHQRIFMAELKVQVLDDETFPSDTTPGAAQQNPFAVNEHNRCREYFDMTEETGNN